MERKEILQPIFEGVAGAKEESHFWRELKKKVKKEGSRKALDAKQEAFTFGGNQAG